MSKINLTIISSSVLLAFLIFVFTSHIYGDISKGLLINLCAGVLTIGVTVFLVDVTREFSKRRRINKMLPVICSEVMTASNNILSLIAMRQHYKDQKLKLEMFDIRDRSAWNEVTEVLLNRALEVKGGGAKYLKNFDLKYMDILYKAVALEEKNLMSIYSRYPLAVEHQKFAETMASLTQSVRQMVWAYEEITNADIGFITAYGKDRGLKTLSKEEVFRYHMSFPIKLFIVNYRSFVLAFRDEIGISKSWVASDNPE